MFEINKKIQCVSVDKMTQGFGQADGDLSQLTVGKGYEVVGSVEHSWHTLVWLRGVEGSFNDCLFAAAAEN